MSQSAATVDLLSPSLELERRGEADDEERAVPTIRHLAFRLRGRPFAIEIRHVLEIDGLQPVTPVHDLPSYVRGLMNLRGHVVPLVDAGERIGLGRREYDERTCIVLLQLDGNEVGVAVDRVTRVVDLPETLFSGNGERPRQDFVRGVYREGDETVLCLDPSYLARVGRGRGQDLPAQEGANQLAPREER